jgi:sterol desaturase/sphingolipid hydroxylase (fatty acid hydroxylase superfamily)
VDTVIHYAQLFLLYKLIPTTKILLTASACGTVLEIISGGQRQSLASRFRGAMMWSAYLLISAPLAYVLYGAFGKLGLQPLVRLDLSWAAASAEPLAWLAAVTIFPFVGLFVGDFFYYWFHRLQHSVPILWHFHRTHHAIEELNAVNNYHHVSEDFFRLPFLVVPMTLLVQVNSTQFVLTAFFLSILGQATHANTQVSFGWLRYVFLEPRFHRLHHSIEPQHWDKNFAFSFPVLDMLFGTARFPHPGEMHATGIPDAHEAKTVREFLFALEPRSTQCQQHHLRPSSPPSPAQPI